MNPRADWSCSERAEDYLKKAGIMPRRLEGETVLLEEIPAGTKRVLDIGAGDGRLLDLVLSKCPDAAAVAMDISPFMLDKLRMKYGNNDRIEVIGHDFNRFLPPGLGRFNVIVSGFAIHHVHDRRKRKLYKEVYNLLEPGGLFCNLERVSSPTAGLHHKFLFHMGNGHEGEKRGNILLDMETQLRWLRDIGFHDVDCYWKWREMALLAGWKKR